MWHHASNTLCKFIRNNLGGIPIVGQLNFVQSSGFLVSVVNTLRWQLWGRANGVDMMTNAKEQAYGEGRTFVKHYFREDTTAPSADVPDCYHGGKPYSPILSMCEEIWFPCKRTAGRLMGHFAPESLGRKMVALVYMPLLLFAIVGLAPPILLMSAIKMKFQAWKQISKEKRP
jgi:hypothetical protein